MKYLSLVLLFFAITQIGHSQNNEVYLLVGTFTSSGNSEGIYVYRFNKETGKSVPVSTEAASNPAYLAVSPDEKYVYSVNEDKPGNITAYSFDKSSGVLTSLNQQPSNGDGPCYIATDKTGKWVVAGNYGSGSLSVYPVQKDGSLGKSVQTIEHTGSSVNEERQQGPHVHSTVFSPDNQFLFVADLGLDKVMIYAFDEKTGELKPAKTAYVDTEAGSGPRHFIFHPFLRIAYLIEELTGTISVFEYASGSLILLQNIPAQPVDYLGAAAGADIHLSPDGKFLYASNRAQSNSIGIFAVDQEQGTLKLVDHQSSLGETPRNFNLDPGGNYLLVGNQNSHEIVVFHRDAETGLLTDSGERIEVGMPVCLKWISME